MGEKIPLIIAILVSAYGILRIMWIGIKFLKSVTHKLKHIIMTQAELATALGDISAQFQKGIDEVVAAVAASGQTTPDVDAAVAKLRAAAQTLDDINPDAPAPTP